MIDWNKGFSPSRLPSVIICAGFLLLLSFYLGTQYILATQTRAANNFPTSSHSQASSSPIASVVTDGNFANWSPTNWPSISDQQYANCASAKPVIDLQGHRTNVKEDSTYVYDANCYVLDGADPKTFVALDGYYGKDSKGVWRIDDPVAAAADDTSSPIAGADPTTFALIPDPRGLEGFSDYYTKDHSHVYMIGQAIDQADPAEFTVDDPPKLTTCQYDASEPWAKYYNGIPLPQPDS